MWTKPRLDWNEFSYFDKDDYNRIKNNLNYLKDLVFELYKPFNFENMGSDRGYFDLIFAEDINKIENNLDRLIKNSYSPDLGVKKTYYANQPFINYEELNRIETASDTLYKNLTGQKEGAKRLFFNLGGGIF